MIKPWGQITARKEIGVVYGSQGWWGQQKDRSGWIGDGGQSCSACDLR